MVAIEIARGVAAEIPSEIARRSQPDQALGKAFGEAPKSPLQLSSEGLGMARVRKGGVRGESKQGTLGKSGC